ncbi:MAG: hypothetical protein JXI43_13445 [Tissierellales bacterium]|nr:hypothetical protein [Tissierellales bacterium]
MDIIERISKKGSDKKQIAKKVISSPEYLPLLFEGLSHDKGTIKFGCEKILRLISEQSPILIYPYFDTFVELLDSENKFIKWGAIITISNLVSVDREKKFERIFDRYYSPITEDAMITAGNIIGNSWKIAFAKPELSDRIAGEILKVENTKYRNKGEISPECTNVVCGHAIESLDKFYNEIKDKKPILNFVKRQLNNSRRIVVKKAERFLRNRKEGL